jgi:hypothetical protein
MAKKLAMQGPLTKGRITQQYTSESGEGINFDKNFFSGIQRRLKERHSTKITAKLVKKV